MRHHLSFGVSDLNRAVAFYDAALAPLHFVRVWADETAVGYGRAGSDDKFAIKLARTGFSIPGEGFHVAFSADCRMAVDQFYAFALQHGGRDNGAPGLRTGYGPYYYAAFVLDPDGYQIEAVINAPVYMGSDA